jgi:glycosyltransferase involved in cell wall biosynthesis
MTNPEISVFMPVYNTAKYLQESIESILTQTFCDFELVIVDDASTDDSYDIIEEYAGQDRRIRPYKNAVNTGIAIACNRAVSLSNGEYIARMDSDDIALGHRLEVQRDFMRANKHLSLCGGWANIIDERGHEIGTFKRPCGWEKINRIVKYTNPVIHPTALFLKSQFLRIGSYRNIPSGVEDYDLILRMNCAGMRIDNIPVYLLRYRTRLSNITHSQGLAQRVVVNAVIELYEERKRRGTDKLDDGTASIEYLIRRHVLEDKGYDKAAQMHLKGQRALANRDFLKAVVNYGAAFRLSPLKRQYFSRLLMCKMILAWNFLLGWDWKDAISISNRREIFKDNKSALIDGQHVEK